jgi:hypothetical protein
VPVRPPAHILRSQQQRERLVDGNADYVRHLFELHERQLLVFLAHHLVIRSAESDYRRKRQVIASQFPATLVRMARFVRSFLVAARCDARSW